MRVGPQKSGGKIVAGLVLTLTVFVALAALLAGSRPFGAHAQEGSSSSAGAASGVRLAQYYPRRYYRGYYPWQRPRYRRPRQRRSYRQPSEPSSQKPVPAVWKVDESNKDPVQLVVSLPKQRISVYKGTELVASSRVSTGRPGYNTPSGVFSILQKKIRHYSNLYGGAAMPNMQRLTWSGVALHASGDVPGYPASHGCVRLPPRFARQLFGFTEMGQHVIIANEEELKLEVFSHPKLFQPLPRPAAPKTAKAAPDASEDEAPAEVKERQAEEAEGEMPTASAVKTADAADSATVGLADDSGGSALASEAATEVAEAEDVSGLAGAGAEQPPDVEEEASDAPSTLPIRILVTKRTGREQLKGMQQVLAELGYQPGDIDGFVGRDTIGAIKRFQKSQGLPENGMLSDELAAQIFQLAGKEQPTGHIYVRQDFKQLFDAPIEIRDFAKPLGTHFFTVMHHEDGAKKTTWTKLSLKDRVRNRRRSRRSRQQPEPVQAENASSASEALDRIAIPDDLRVRISQLLEPGSSLVISDKGLGPETGKGTDFIALTIR